MPVDHSCESLRDRRSIPAQRTNVAEEGVTECPKRKTATAPMRQVAVFIDISGAAKRSRTSDLRITSALLYQLSYCGLTGMVAPAARRG